MIIKQKHQQQKENEIKKKTKRIIRGDKNVIAEGNEFIPKLI